MREIKFRAWDKKKKIMLYFSLKTLSNDYELSESVFDSWNNAITMQFTGLKDKDGKEIYEGDIMLIPSSLQCSLERIGVVIFDEWRYLINIKKPEPCGQSFLNLNTDFIEVLGNIYENPKLLEKKEWVKNLI